MDGLEHVSLHSDCWSVDKQSFSLQQDHALSVQKYYTHNWAFQFLSLEERDDGIITKLEHHSSCIATACISSPRLLLFLLPWSNTNSGLSSSAGWDWGDNEGREGEQSLSMYTRVPVAVWYLLSPLQCSHDMQNLLSSFIFSFPIPLHLFYSSCCKH